MKITAKAIQSIEPLVGATKYVPPSNGLMNKIKPTKSEDTPQTAIAGYIRNIRSKRS
jgi:hypothetical protein|tara:strand:+ start:22 stop:192 length:171 start_codon:yes stop_codon:yes gene_type:complete